MSAEPLCFEYVVWIRDLRFPPDDQDYEWPAVFAIEADTAEAAQVWGDHLAHAYVACTADIFVSSACLMNRCFYAIQASSPGPKIPVASKAQLDVLKPKAILHAHT
jgi:hypothetical protein